MSRSNPNKPLPYYRHYVDRWRGDRRVQRLNVTAKGIARELLDEAWLNGCFTNDLVKIAEICGCRLSIVEREWEQIKVLFREVENTDGQLLTSDFIETERTEQDTIRSKRAIAGRLGGIKKANASNSQQMPYSSSRGEKSSDAEAFASADAQMLRCADCGSRGVALAAGIHAPNCTSAVLPVAVPVDPVELSDEAAR